MGRPVKRTAQSCSLGSFSSGTGEYQIGGNGQNGGNVRYY